MDTNDCGEQQLAISNEIIPSEILRLHQNYPNPFNPITKIGYNLFEKSFVNITVYDMLGNVTKNLIYEDQPSGYNEISWNATNNQGKSVSAGIYLYRIEASNFRQTKKMILLK